MLNQPRILLLDDDQDFLDLYKEMLSQHLPSLPEVKTAPAGARALTMLESEPFSLMILDLNMPKMDGLQVISIARRKYPEMRLVVLTGMRDEQFRTRAYAMGVDQYWIKPESDQEMGLFIESVETLLSRDVQGGFRGVQSKSLVDIIQLECLSQSSVVLKITHGKVEGKIWIQNGEVIDAQAGDLVSEPAFQRLLTWKTGSFELLPGDSTRTRTIFTSYQGLLLNTAQSLDEQAAEQAQLEEDGTDGDPLTEADRAAPLLAELADHDGVEFILVTSGRDEDSRVYWGMDNPKPTAEWVEETMARFRALGERLRVGQLQTVVGTDPHRRVSISNSGDSDICVGFSGSTTPEAMRDTMKIIVNKWAS